MSTSGLKTIAPVPTAADFLDIVLSKTQRKTPTVCCQRLYRMGRVYTSFHRLFTKTSRLVAFVTFICAKLSSPKIPSMKSLARFSLNSRFSMYALGRTPGLTFYLPRTAHMQDLHPFLSSLMNVLYDKNHYKLALGQLRTARHLIDQVAKDYVRLLKFGDSLYRCKQLKRAALGRYVPCFCTL
jgi:nucleolar GTP-binding protein